MTRTHEEIAKNHFQRLGSYRNSKEYAEFARSIGDEVPSGELPSLLGDRWEIDQQTYDQFLNILPPMGWRGDSFYMCEFSFEDITTKYTKEGDRYFCEFARYPERRKPRVQTPWGEAQDSKEYAPGIVFHSTASHGGFHLSAERIAEMPKALQEFVPFGGPQKGPGRWFEEDCDWSVVALSFPQFFREKDIEAAHRTLKGYRPEVWAAFMAERPGTSVAPASVEQQVEEKAR